MDNNALQQLARIFEGEQEAFRQAQARYREACQSYQYFKALEFIPTPPLARAAYSDRMAWILAIMSKLAYIPFERQAEELARLRFHLLSGEFELIDTFNVADTQAFLAKHDAYAVLAFRGTQIEAMGDIRTDIQVRYRSTRVGKIHSGFNMAYDDVAELVAGCIGRLDGCPLYITGHSLGGALATIATQRLEQVFTDQIAACYTFGSPRVGNDDYDKSIKASIYRVVNSIDIVTLIPLLTMGYTHIGDTRYLTRDGGLRRGIRLALRGWDAMVSMLLSLPRVLMPWVAAHRIDAYIEKLGAIAIERNKTESGHLHPPL